MTRIMWDVDLVKEWTNKNSNCKFLSNVYINIYTKYKFKCKCGDIFERDWYEFRVGSMICQKCSIEVSANKRKSIKGKNVIFKKLTLDIIKQRLKIISPTINIISKEYVNSKTKLNLHCKTCSYKWKANWNKLNNGKGCPSCGGSLKKTLKDIVTELYKISPTLTIESEEYLTSGSMLKVKCLVCENDFNVSWDNLKKGRNCPKCRYDKIKGSGNYMWKGGITPLAQYLRDLLCEWKKDSMINCEYKCILTGDRFNSIHHLYSFNKIIKETILEVNLPILSNISKYSEIELRAFKDVFIKIHSKYPLGVCLNKKTHDLYHRMYGFDNTPEQFKEFIQRYTNGEFESIISNGNMLI